MPYVLRKIKQGRWWPTAWLSSDDDLPADAMSDLKTEGNELSVWWVNDDQSNLETIIAALAANCEFVANFDYALIRLADLDSLSLTVRESFGKTPCPGANQYHRDICELTGRKLLEIGLAIFRQSETRQRFPQRQVIDLLHIALTSGWIDRSRLNESLVEDLQKRR